MAFQRPDVYVSESLKTSIQSTTNQASPLGAFIGTSWKGPSVPTLVNSWTEYSKLFGGFVSGREFSYLHYAVWQHFLNGGGPCYVVRVYDSATVATSTVTLVDRAGTPVSTLKVDAYSSGDWGDNLRVLITDQDATAGRFNITVYDGTAVDANIVERWSDLSMVTNDERYAPAVVNAVEGRGSQYIRLTDMNSATAAPNDTPALGTFTLAAGADGSTVDAADWAAAVDKLDSVDRPLVVALPGESSSAIVNDAAAYVDGRADCFLVIDTATSTAASAAVTYAASVVPATSYAAVYWPWVNIVDPATNRSGATIKVPPSGSVVGRMIATDRQFGPQQTPAGIGASLNGVVSLETDATISELNSLNDGRVNALRNFYNSGPVIMGGRTLQKSGSARYISVRRSLIYVRDALTRQLRFSLFQPNDGSLRGAVSNEAAKFLNDFWVQKGLAGGSPSEAFFVKCDDENNPQSAIEQGELHIEVGVALQHPAEFIILKIGSFESGQLIVTEGA